MTDSSASAAPARSSQVNLAVGLAVATVAVWIVLAVIDHDGPIWLLVAVLGALAAIVGWRAGEGSRPTGLALGAVIVGALGVLSVLGWIIADAM